MIGPPLWLSVSLSVLRISLLYGDGYDESMSGSGSDDGDMILILLSIPISRGLLVMLLSLL